MWHREDAEWCGPGWRYTPQMDTNMEELNSKLAEANVKFRHQNAELAGANFKLHNQNVQLRQWCNHLGRVVASQKQRIKSVQADLEDVRTERDNLLAAGRHFDSILHRGMVCTAPPAPRAEFASRPPTRLNLRIPNNGGQVDRTVSGVWLDGFLSPLTNCDPTTRSPFAEYTPEEKEKLRRYLLTQRGPANGRAGGHGKALSLDPSSAGIPKLLQKANAPSASRESNSRSSDSPQEACVSPGTGSPTSALHAEVAPGCHEKRLLMPSTDTSGKCIRSPYEGNVGPELPEETLRMSSTEPSEKSSKTLTGNGNDTITGSLDERQAPRCPFMSGNLGDESSKQGDDVSGAAGPGGETDDESLEGARTETDEPGPTKHERKTHRNETGENPPGVTSSDEAWRSEGNTEEKPGAPSPEQPSAQISGDEVSIPDSPNSVPVSEAPDSQNEEPEAVEPCDDSTDFADPRSSEVVASRSARPHDEKASKHAKDKQNVSATPASSAWSSRYPHKLYSVNPANDRGSGGSQGKGRQGSVVPGGSGDNETSVEDEISSDRYTHVTHCCWCFNGRLETQAVALCEGCPRIICRQCMLKVGLRVPSGDNSRDSILPASSCRCLKFDSEFRKPPRTAQPEAHLLEQLRRHDLSFQFREPVDTESNPNYLSVITKEKMMDLATLAEKMKNRCYQTPRGQRKFLLDLRQIWSNCMEYAQYDPEDQAPIPGIVSCTLILANMVDEYFKSNMKVLTLTLDEKSWLAARESLKQTKFCEMVKGNPRYMTPTVNTRQGSVEKHQMDDDLTKRILPSSSGSTSVKRTFSSLSSSEGDSSDPEEVISRTLCILADVGDRLVQEAKRRRGTRNDS